MAEVAVIIVSHNCATWLTPCLTSLFAHAGDAELDVIVVDNGSSDGSPELVEQHFPSARVLRERNLGFAYGCNRGLEAADAPFVLFLNPDTEILEGTLAALVDAMRERPCVGLAGCRQLTPDGALFPTIRRFPSAGRHFLEALGCERFPFRAGWRGERILEPSAYDQEVRCDWTSGSFMFARREAVVAVGFMDERFFIYCEEPDLCIRIKLAGWDVRHIPTMTILHHANKDSSDPRLAAQNAYARRQYFFKHFSPMHRLLAIGALALYHAIRVLVIMPDRDVARSRRACHRAALRTLLGFTPPPFGNVQGADQASVIIEPTLAVK